jgi:hypothetical protein
LCSLWKEQAAIQGELDLLGLMVLSFATALAGGIICDPLIGAIPPGDPRLALSGGGSSRWSDSVSVAQLHQPGAAE